MLVLAAGSIDSGNNRTSTPSTGGSSMPTKKWYEGGTLHNKSALEWQTASREDRLATCADFVTKMWQDGNPRPAIADNLRTVDDVRPYAQELVDCLDAAFKPDPDPEQHHRLFTNQTVSGTAAIGMVIMGWTTLAQCIELTTTPPDDASAAPPVTPQNAIERQPDHHGQDGGEEFLREHLSELLTMKDKGTFKFYGFGQGGPHYQWLAEVQAEHNKNRYTRDMDIAIGTLLNLGLEYAMNRGGENGYTRYARQQIEDVIKGKSSLNHERTESAKWRTWTTSDGKYSVEAKFVKFAFGTLTLEKKDGSTVDVKLDLLCPEDQEFVRERKWTRSGDSP